MFSFDSIEVSIDVQLERTRMSTSFRQPINIQEELRNNEIKCHEGRGGLFSSSKQVADKEDLQGFATDKDTRDMSDDRDRSRSTVAAQPQPGIAAGESGSVLQIDRIARDEHFPFSAMRSIDWLLRLLDFVIVSGFFVCLFLFLRFFKFPCFPHSFRSHFFIGLSCLPSFFLFLYSVFRNSEKLPPTT